MYAVSDAISFGSEVFLAWNVPNLANDDTVNDVVGNFEMPKMGGVASRY